MNKYAPNVQHVSTQNARKRSEFCFRNATFAYLASKNFWRSILDFCMEKVPFWCIFINISGREWPEAYPYGLYSRESFREVSCTSPGIFRPFGAIPGTVGSKMSILKFLKKMKILPPPMHAHTGGRDTSEAATVPAKHRQTTSYIPKVSSRHRGIQRTSN